MILIGLQLSLPITLVGTCYNWCIECLKHYNIRKMNCILRVFRLTLTLFSENCLNHWWFIRPHWYGKVLRSAAWYHAEHENSGFTKVRIKNITYHIHLTGIQVLQLSISCKCVCGVLLCSIKSYLNSYLFLHTLIDTG